MLKPARLSCALVLVVLASCTDGIGPDRSEIAAPITVPSGFTNRIVTTSVSAPTALDFLPDGTLLVTARAGRVHVVTNSNSPSVSTALDITSKVCSNRERGLLGIAVDPAFATNKKVYVYYTFNKNPSAGCPQSDAGGSSVVNRVSRFDYDTSTRRLSNERVLVDNILSNNGWHNAGDLKFGQDGFLYIGIGDSGADLSTGATGWGNGNSRHKSILQGKVLRVVKDTGAPAPGNPWLGVSGSRRCGDPAQTPRYPRNSTEPCQETFAWGLRNPYRLAFKRGTNTFFINEVGQNIGGDWEEINTGVAGADYGWNRNQGPTSDGSTRSPTHAYEIGMTVDGQACRCITGGTFVTNGAWTSTYDDSYLFADYTCGAIFRIKQSSGTWNRTIFARGAGVSSIVHLAFGPNPAGGESLYYLSLAGNQLGRIDGPAGNNAPIAQVRANPTFGPTPLTVNFDGSGSRDPDAGDGIARYKWSFGDGSAVQTTTTPTVSHTYTTAANVTATLTVEDTRSPPLSSSATIQLYPGDLPPTVQITAPADGSQFIVGQPVTLTASASDPNDGTLPASALSWEVLKVHDDHTHPFASETGNNVTVTPDGPEELGAVANSHFRIKVTARDSRGQTATDVVEIFPTIVPITVGTVPAGLSLKVNGVARGTPSTFDAWQGWRLPLEAPAQTVGGVSYVFDHWSDGGAASHAVTVPATATTYTATFREGAATTRINFQPATAVVPAGYLKDDGAAYGDRGNGLTYGWNVTNPLTRERNVHPDQRYDTDIMMEKSGAQYSWDIALPSGVYQVKLVAGDAQYFDGSYHITAEGQAFLDGTPSSTNRFIEVDREVTVTDGRLSLANGAGSVLSRVCFIEITRLRDVAFTANINFQPAASEVPAGYLKDDGAAFGARGNGLSYGWNVTNPLTRERNVHPDQRYDTDIMLEKSGAQYSWEIAVPSGTYQVRLIAGDAQYFDGSYHITAEGQAFLDGTPSSTNRFIEVTRNVTVTDGRLTLANGPGSVLSRVCFIEIVRQP